MSNTAQIIADYGRRFNVRTQNGIIFDAVTRQKRVDFACGDWVNISLINNNQAVIENYLPRKSLIFRQDKQRTKLIAANIDKLFIITAPIPAPNEILLQRALLAAEAANIGVVIVANKIDLPEIGNWRKTLSFYEFLGYPVVETCAKIHADTLKPLMQGNINIFLGQSGMGKSTLTNTLSGNAAARIGEISTALNSGKHTTTHTRLYNLDKQTKLIDSPGLQEFGLSHLNAKQLLQYFPDFRHLIGQCRFHNCTHRTEPGCAVKSAVEADTVYKKRLVFLQQVTNEILC